MSDREARRDLLAEMGAEAMPGGRLTMALFGPHAPMAALAALTAGDVTGRALAEALPRLLRGRRRHCGACGGPLDFPATIAILHADRPDAHAALALGCCSACTADGPAALRRKLTAFLGTIFTGLRALDPTHAAPEAVQ